MLSLEELNKLIEEAPKNDKGQSVLPDDIFVENARNLPYGTRSESGYFAKDGGYITPLQKGTQATREFASMGGKATQEINRRRRTFAESIDILLKSECDDGETYQDKVIKAMVEKALSGCVGASEFLRDTVGEKPSDNLNLDVMTDADKQLIENLKARINELKGTKG